MDRITKNCEYCNEPYSHNRSQKSKYCSQNCSVKANIQLKIVGIENIDYVVCGICKLKYKEINADHLRMHRIEKEEYDDKYGNRTSEKTRNKKDTLSSRLTSELSKKLSDSHKIVGYVKKYGEKVGMIKYNEMIDNLIYGHSVDFYIEKYGEKDGVIKYRELQNKKVITLESQINKYGTEEGTKRYNSWKEKQKNKNTISYFIELYGYDEGLNRWFEKNNKISISNSKIDGDKRHTFELYCLEVNKFTRMSLQMFELKDIELRGEEFGYDLDHMVSKIYGFKNKIEPEIIGHISNLKIITSSDNSRKRHKLSKDISTIIESCNNDVEYNKIVRNYKSTIEDKINFISLERKGRNCVEKLKRFVIVEKYKPYSQTKGKVNIKKYKLIDPLGNEYITDSGLTLFCEQHNLTAANMHRVLTGKSQHHKHWVIERVIS